MTGKFKFDALKMMGMAVEVMKKSVCEPRNDDKACPLVGAVIFRPDGIVETACRGELRYGDHAEYTLLERKNRGNRLDGAILFTTLEPCAPGSRRHPKLSCAERIVLARIREVWVGIEDPDPTVDRKGIRCLQDSGATVHMFDPELQEAIRIENKDFIAQAMKRAAAEDAEKKPKAIKLSDLEDPSRSTEIGDLSTEALEQYRIATKIEGAVGSELFHRRLLYQGVLKRIGEKFIPTGFGFLLFGKEPRDVMPQSGILGTIHYPNGKEETKDFDGPLVLVPGLVQEWIKNKLPLFTERREVRRQESPDLPFELIREAVVNAVVHRDYDIRGAKCQLVITEDTITVKSPGGPPAPITLEQLQSFNAPALSRNPEIHYVFARMAMAEERGLGMKSLKTRPVEFGLPLPRYSLEEPYLVLTLYRNAESAMRNLPPKILETLNKDERAGLIFLFSQTKTTKAGYAKHMGYDDRKAQRHLKQFVELGLLQRIGAGPATEYLVVRS